MAIQPIISKQELSYRANRNIILFYATDFCFNLVFLIPVWVTFYTRYFSLSQISLISVASTACMLLLQIPTGVFADIFGRKTSMIIGSVIRTIGNLTIVFWHNPVSIIIGEIGYGIGTSFVSGANVALLYDSLKDAGREKEFYKIRTINQSITQGALIGSTFLAGYLFNLWNLLPFLVTAVAIFLTGILSFFFSETLSINSLQFEKKTYREKTVNGVKEIFKNKETTFISIFYILVGGITWSWQVFFNQILATNIGYDVVGKSWLFAIIRFVNVIIIIRLFHLEKYISKRNVYFVYPILMILAAIPAIISSQIVGTALLFLLTFLPTLRLIVLDQYVNEQYESKYRATALSTLNMFVSIAQIVIVFLGGLLLDKYSTGVVYFFTGCATVVFILPIGIYLSNTNRKLSVV